MSYTCVTVSSLSENIWGYNSLPLESRIHYSYKSKLASSARFKLQLQNPLFCAKVSKFASAYGITAWVAYRIPCLLRMEYPLKQPRILRTKRGVIASYIIKWFNNSYSLMIHIYPVRMWIIPQTYIYRQNTVFDIFLQS